MTVKRISVWKQAQDGLVAFWKLMTRPVDYSWKLAAFQVPLLILASYYYWVPPSSGLMSLVIVVVVMTIRQEERWSRTEKTAWLLLVISLSLVEGRAVVNDREEAERRHSDHMRKLMVEFKTMFQQQTRFNEQQYDLIRRTQALRDEVSKMDSKSFESWIRRNQRISRELTNLLSQVEAFERTHFKIMAGIDDNYMRPIGMAESPEAKAKLEAEKKRLEEAEQKRYEKEYADKTEPQMVRLLSEILSSLGEDVPVSETQIAKAYGLDDPNSAQAHMQFIKSRAEPILQTLKAFPAPMKP